MHAESCSPTNHDHRAPLPASRLGVYACLLATAALLIFFRMHAFELPLETDECNYAYIGGRLLDGDRLYEDVWDHQPPGVFVMFAGLTALLGQSDTVIRWMATGFSLASLALIFHIARRSHGLEAGALAAALFAIVSSDPGSAGEGCNREIYMNVFALAAVAILMRRDNRRHALLAGLLLGLGSTFKTVMAAQWLLLTLWAVARTWSREKRWRPAIATLFWLGTGPALVWSSVSLYFALTGRWTDFIDATFTFNIGYSGLERGFFTRYLDFATAKPYVFHSAMPLWIAAAIAFPSMLLLGRRRLAMADGAILAYAFGSLQAVCLPGQFWPHYYYLLIPPVVLLCAPLPRLIMDRLRSFTGRTFVRTVSYTWLAAVLWYALIHYLLVEPNQITAPRYDYRQQWARAQGLRVGGVTDPGDTVFVWGKDVGVYRYSGRRCASRYTMVGALDEHARGFQKRRDTLLAELKSRRPRIVLIVEEEFDELTEFLQANYFVAGVDRDDDNPDKVIMLALMDRAHPIERVDWEWRAPKPAPK